MGHLLLAGGVEFRGDMSETDLKAMELAGGFDAPICIIPTAAAPDHNHKRAGNNGIRWFKSLGAKHVFSVDVTDSASANDEALAGSIRTSSMVYLLGGFPRHLGETLANSLCWQAVLDVYKSGGVVGGSSAGAMVLCEYYNDPYERKILKGLNLVHNSCVLPHHNSFGKTWADALKRSLPGVTLFGIDESTGIITRDGSEWQVYGPGEVTVYRAESSSCYKRADRFSVF